MKIIKEGILRKPIYQATCYYCKTEIEFEQSEGAVTHDRRDGDFITVTCPICHKLITVAVK